MTGFLDLCGKATTADCAFSAGSPAATRAKWNTLLSRVLRHPVTIGSPPQTYTYADVVETPPLGIVQNWPAGAVQLQQLWVASATSPGTSKRAVNAPAAAPAVDIPAGTPAVLCPDTDNPRDVAAYTADAKLAYAEAGGFGLFYAWTTEECADWADGGAPDRYTGPWNRPTASTILVLGNTGDPQLPYADSVAMSRELARARLLTIDGYGHTEALNPSTCAIGYETSYLLTGALPPAGTACEENLIPFSNG